MPARIEESAWRDKRWNSHGPDLFENIKKRYLNKNFNIQMVANLNAISHLTDRSAYDTATAVCRELELRKMLRRHGRLFTLTNRGKNKSYV